MKRALQLFNFLLTVLISLPFALLPWRLSLKAGEVMGGLLFHVWRSRRLIAVENLRTAASRGAVNIDSTPEEIIKLNFRNMGKSFAEVIKLYYGLDTKVLENIEIRGIENFKKAQARGAGVFFIGGHCGNWELTGIALSLKLSSIHGIARQLNNLYLNNHVERVRKKYGNTVIYKKGALKKILLALRENHAVGILMDQSVIRSEGIVAEFLGKKAYIMKIPAIIARKTGSPVLPVFIRRSENGHVVEIGGEIPLDTAEDYGQAVYNDTVNFSRQIENYIKGNPAEWLWIHRRWKRIKSDQNNTGHISSNDILHQEVT
jgi:Kdo2-lipid IVA lauroyltransferase/acyltransferase